MIVAQLKTKPGGRSPRKLLTAVMSADPSPLMEEWERILLADNERRLLDGLDVHERPMAPTLRERGIGGQWRTIRGKRVLIEPDPNPPAGPPLVPFGRRSRFIALARTRHEFRPPNEWAAQLGWPDFLSDDARWIPGFHRRGDGLPVRDQVSRPSDTAIRLARQAMAVWVRRVYRSV